MPSAVGFRQSESPRDPIFGPDGNLYVTDDVSLDGGIPFGSLLWSATPSGTVLLTGVTSQTIGPLAAWTDFIVGQGFGAIGLDGGTLFELPASDDVSPFYCADSQLVDPAGDAIWAGGLPGDAGIAGIYELSPAGRARWSASSFPGLWRSCLADDGSIFALEVTCPCFSDCAGPPTSWLTPLVALTPAGELRWLTGVPQAGSSYLALTPHASLLMGTSNGIVAIFAGQFTPATSAPWSRDRGNDNRGAPPPTP